MENKEFWKDIFGFENIYQVSNYGNIKALPAIKKRGRFYHNLGERIMKQTVSKLGYLRISLSKDNSQKIYNVHRLVATAFIDNPENKAQVNHKDGNKANNHVSNLEWCTAKENCRHADETGLRNLKGESHHKSKLTNEDVINIRKDYCGINRKNMNSKDLCEKYGITNGNLHLILNRKSWKHI